MRKNDRRRLREEIGRFKTPSNPFEMRSSALDSNLTGSKTVRPRWIRDSTRSTSKRARWFGVWTCKNDDERVGFEFERAKLEFDGLEVKSCP
jgi:hypothetical protein